MTRMIVVWTMCYRLGKFALQLGTLIYMRHLMIPTHVILSCEVSWISTCGVFACSTGLFLHGGLLRRVLQKSPCKLAVRCVCVRACHGSAKVHENTRKYTDPRVVRRRKIHENTRKYTKVHGLRGGAAQVNTRNYTKVHGSRGGTAQENTRKYTKVHGSPGGAAQKIHENTRKYTDPRVVRHRKIHENTRITGWCGAGKYTKIHESTGITGWHGTEITQKYTKVQGSLGAAAQDNTRVRAAGCKITCNMRSPSAAADGKEKIEKHQDGSERVFSCLFVPTALPKGSEC